MLNYVKTKKLKREQAETYLFFSKPEDIANLDPELWCIYRLDGTYATYRLQVIGETYLEYVTRVHGRRQSMSNNNMTH